MKNGLKKLSILSLASIMMYTSNLTYAAAYSPENAGIPNSEIQVITDEDFNSEIDNDFQEVFPEEMARLKQLGESKINRIKNEEQLFAETQEMEPIIDVEKNVGEDYYRIVGYSNGIYYQSGVKGGTSTTGSGYVAYKNRIAYGKAQSPSVNALSGHTFSVNISYTLVKGGYDSIQTDYVGSDLLAVTNFFNVKRVKNETSSAKAYTKWQYTGRNGLNNQTGKYTMTVSVGKDGISVSGNWIA